MQMAVKDEIPVCVAYEIDGNTTVTFPVTSLPEAAELVDKILSGWKCDISRIRKYSDLSSDARRHVAFIEEVVGIPVRMISNGF